MAWVFLALKQAFSSRILLPFSVEAWLVDCRWRGSPEDNPFVGRFPAAVVGPVVDDKGLGSRATDADSEIGDLVVQALESGLAMSESVIRFGANGI